jgi:hypothetical protein
MKREMFRLVLVLLVLGGGLSSVPFVALPVAAQQTKEDAENQTVYVTRTGAKYHRDGCRYLCYSRIPMKLKDPTKRFGPMQRVQAADHAGQTVVLWNRREKTMFVPIQRCELGWHPQKGSGFRIQPAGGPWTNWIKVEAAGLAAVGAVLNSHASFFDPQSFILGGSQPTPRTDVPIF